MPASNPAPSSKETTGLGLLKRNPALSVDEFKDQYIHHASVVMPWCLANGVTYYAQVRYK